MTWVHLRLALMEALGASVCTGRMSHQRVINSLSEVARTCPTHVRRSDLSTGERTGNVEAEPQSNQPACINDIGTVTHVVKDANLDAWIFAKSELVGS